MTIPTTPEACMAERERVLAQAESKPLADLAVYVLPRGEDHWEAAYDEILAARQAYADLLAAHADALARLGLAEAVQRSLDSEARCGPRNDYAIGLEVAARRLRQALATAQGKEVE